MSASRVLIGLACIAFAFAVFGYAPGGWNMMAAGLLLFALAHL